NRLSDLPMSPTSADEPTVAAFDRRSEPHRPEAGRTPLVDARWPTAFGGAPLALPGTFGGPSGSPGGIGGPGLGVGGPRDIRALSPSPRSHTLDNPVPDDFMSSFDDTHGSTPPPLDLVPGGGGDDDHHNHSDDLPPRNPDGPGGPGGPGGPDVPLYQSEQPPV